MDFIDFKTEFGYDLEDDDISHENNELVFDNDIKNRTENLGDIISHRNTKLKIDYEHLNRDKLNKIRCENNKRRYATDPEYRKKCLEYSKQYKIKRIDPIRYKIKKEINELYQSFAILKIEYENKVKETLNRINELKNSLKRIPISILEGEEIKE